jgi:TolA-binding protein
MFQQLQRQFPSSAEAQLSRLSLGRVWLAQGRAQQALEQFSGYLASGGPLTEEALLGKARALAALGRFGEERAVWQTLQRRFPNSVYQAQAEQRLRQLDVKARQ